MLNEFFDHLNGWEKWGFWLTIIMCSGSLMVSEKTTWKSEVQILVSLSPLVFQSEVHTIELVQGNPCPGSSLVKEFASCQAATVLSWSGMVCLDNLAHQKGGDIWWSSNFWQWSSRPASEAQNHSVICSLSAPHLREVIKSGKRRKSLLDWNWSPWWSQTSFYRLITPLMAFKSGFS